MARRVVVTGVGMVTSLGVTAEESWAGLTAGKSGVSTMDSWVGLEFAGTKFPVSIAAHVRNFDPEPWMQHKKDVKRMERFIQFCQAAGLQAWRQSGLPEQLSDEAGNRAGCIIGVGLGGLGGILNAYDILKEKGPRRISAFFIPAIVAARGQLGAGVGVLVGQPRHRRGVPARARRPRRHHVVRRRRERA
jgi:3-oxoacyl-[acyl-carrier-protein] synthase II